jgi:hypothetical protein
MAIVAYVNVDMRNGCVAPVRASFGAALGEVIG